MPYIYLCLPRANLLSWAISRVGMSCIGPFLAINLCLCEVRFVKESKGCGPILALSPSYLEYTEEGDLFESCTTDCVRVGRGMS